MEVNLGVGTQEECPFPLNRGVPLIKVTNTKIVRTFFPGQVLYPMNGGVPEESFHCITILFSRYPQIAKASLGRKVMSYSTC